MSETTEYLGDLRRTVIARDEELKMLKDFNNRQALTISDLRREVKRLREAVRVFADLEACPPVSYLDGRTKPCRLGEIMEDCLGDCAACWQDYAKSVLEEKP